MEFSCYVLHKGFYNPILQKKYESDWMLWPEDGLNMMELAQGIIYQANVITENPWIISCYSRENVFVWRDGEWVNPDMQTFAASIDFIMFKILLIGNTIPASIISHDAADKLKEKITNLYKT